MALIPSTLNLCSVTGQGKSTTGRGNRRKRRKGMFTDGRKENLGNEKIVIAEVEKLLAMMSAYMHHTREAFNDKNYFGCITETCDNSEAYVLALARKCSVLRDLSERHCSQLILISICYHSNCLVRQILH